MCKDYVRNKIIYETECEADAPGGSFLIEYLLLSGKEADRECFSVLCILHDGDVAESRFVFDAAPDRASGILLCDLLCRCEVTPFSLVEVLSEYLA